MWFYLIVMLLKQPFGNSDVFFFYFTQLFYILHWKYAEILKCNGRSLLENHMISHTLQPQCTRGFVLTNSRFLISRQKGSQPLKQAVKSCKVLRDILIIQKCSQISIYKKYTYKKMKRTKLIGAKIIILWFTHKIVLKSISAIIITLPKIGSVDGEDCRSLMPVGAATHGGYLRKIQVTNGKANQCWRRPAAPYISSLKYINKLSLQQHVRCEMKFPLRSNQQRRKCKTTIVFSQLRLECAGMECSVVLVLLLLAPSHLSGGSTWEMWTIFITSL